MKEYYSNLYLWVFKIIMVTVIFVPVVYCAIKRIVVNGDSIIIVMSCIFSALLLAAYYFLYLSIKHPVVVVDGVRILVRDYFLSVSVVEDLHQYKLVVSSDFLAFRKEGQQDIMVNERYFSPKQWGILVNELKSLQFAGVVE